MTIDPEMTRREVLLLLRDRETPPDLLRAVAENRDWMGYQEIRRALARRAGRTLIGALIDCATGRELQGLLGNPRTPVPAALRSLRGLSTRDLRRLYEDETVPRIVRVGAERLLKTPGSGSGRPNVARTRDV